MKKRREQFSEELVAICYDFYHDQKEEEESDDTQSIRNWPPHFDVENVTELGEFELKPKPVSQARPESV